MAKFAINESGAMLLPSSVHVSESISGSVVPLAMFLLNSENSLQIMGILEEEKHINFVWFSRRLWLGSVL